MLRMYINSCIKYKLNLYTVKRRHGMKLLLGIDVSSIFTVTYVCDCVSDSMNDVSWFLL